MCKFAYDRHSFDTTSNLFPNEKSDLKEGLPNTATNGDSLFTKCPVSIKKKKLIDTVMHSNVSNARARDFLHCPKHKIRPGTRSLRRFHFKLSTPHPHFHYERLHFVCVWLAKWNQIDPLIPIITSLSMLIPHDNKEPRFFISLFVVVFVVVAVFVRFSWFAWNATSFLMNLCWISGRNEFFHESNFFSSSLLAKVIGAWWPFVWRGVVKTFGLMSFGAVDV